MGWISWSKSFKGSWSSSSHSFFFFFFFSFFFEGNRMAISWYGAKKRVIFLTLNSILGGSHTLVRPSVRPSVCVCLWAIIREHCPLPSEWVRDTKERERDGWSPFRLLAQLNATLKRSNADEDEMISFFFSFSSVQYIAPLPPFLYSSFCSLLSFLLS